MFWLALTLCAIISWGSADIFYKKSSGYNDSFYHYKTFIWVGMVMAPAGAVIALCSDTMADSIRTFLDNLYFWPLCIFYALALLFGLLGKKHLDVSVVSPLENINGAITAVMLYLYFMFTGHSEVTDSIGLVDIIATLFIFSGIIFLGIQEHTLSKQEADLAEEEKRHRLGALAIIFPIVGTLVDSISMVVIGITVSEETEVAIPDLDLFFFVSVMFAGIAVILWLYLLIVKNYRYNPFRKTELVRCGAAIGETFGTMTYLLAMARNPILTSPITSSYCLVTIVLARIFLKERLTKRQYLSLAFLVTGIAMLGISEISGI